MKGKGFLDLSDGKLVGKGLSALANSQAGRNELIALFGGRENLPSSIMRHRRPRMDKEVDSPATDRSYTKTCKFQSSGGLAKLPKSVKKNFDCSGKGSEGALSTFPQNIGRTIALLYSEPGQTVFDPFCVTPDTWIITESGMKHIENVTTSDLVLTHKGRYRKVSDVMQRRVKEKVTRLRVAGAPPLRITKDHLVLVIRTVACTYYSNRHKVALPSCSHCKSGSSYQRVKKGAVNYRGYRVRKCYQPWLGYKAEWVRAGDVRPGDYMLFPTSGEQKPVDSIPLAKYALLPRDFDLSVPVSSDSMWMLGMYVAEGHVGGGTGLTWTVGSHEHAYAQKIARIGRRCFRCRLKVRSRPDSNVYDVHGTKSTAARFLLDHFGHLAPNKRLPHWLMELPLSFQAAFLKGYVQGDGHVLPADAPGGEGVIVVSTSPHLAGQTKVLFARQGIASSVSVRSPNTIAVNDKWGIQSKHDAWRIQVTGSGVPNAHLLLGVVGRRKKHYSSYSFAHDGYIAYRVLSVGETPYSGMVYNLSVEEDESYTTLQGVVHNCGHNSRAELVIRTGRHYTGCDLSAEFMQFNRKRAAELREEFPKARIVLHEGDSRKVPVESNSHDFTLTSPPPTTT